MVHLLLSRCAAAANEMDGATDRNQATNDAAADAMEHAI
mgnify:CR=1 FL=1